MQIEDRKDERERERDCKAGRRNEIRACFSWLDREATLETPRFGKIW